MKTFTVVMSGGGGSRFWPLSRKTHPKQLLNLSGRDIMLNDTIQRMDRIVSRRHTYIITNSEQEKLTKKLLISGVSKKNVLIEPIGRNTAACVLYAALVLNKKYEDGVMCMLPADHFISDEESYIDVIQTAVNAAKKTEGLVTIGIKPNYPATGFGYIEMGEDCSKINAYSASGFREKPDEATATEYLDSGKFLWNSGIFVWKISAVCAAFQKYMPDMYTELMKMYNDIGTKYEKQRLESIYPLLESISVDYAIMEKADNVYVVPGDFGWNDVGSLNSLELMLPKDIDKNAINGEGIMSQSDNCIVYGYKPTVVMGCSNLMVIDTEDALLVCPKDKAQDIKKIVERIDKQGPRDIL